MVLLYNIIIINLFIRRLSERLDSDDYYDYARYGDSSNFTLITTHIAQRNGVGRTFMGSIDIISIFVDVFSR